MTKIQWDKGLGFRMNADGTGSWYKQSWSGGRDGKAVRVTLGHWPEMTREQARAAMSSTLELYLSTIPETAWGKAHKSRLKRYPLPRTKRDTLDTLDRIQGVSAKRSYWDSLRLYGKWAKERDLFNPCEGLSAPKSGESRERELSWEELKIIWQVTDFAGFGHYVRVLILSAQRRTEVTNFAWKDVEGIGPGMLWKNVGKGGSVNLVPIETFARYLGPGWKPTTSYSKAKAKLDAIVRLDPWTLHDLRRTAATRMGELGVDPFHIERVLGHSVPGVAKVYNRYKYVPQVRQALLTWGRALGSRVGP